MFGGGKLWRITSNPTTFTPKFSMPQAIPIQTNSRDKA